jgi:protein-export membrane protein SecD
MANKRILAVLLIVIGVALGAFIYYSEIGEGTAWWQKKFRLGLDLSGGSHLVYQADVSKIPTGSVDEAMDSLREVIERRVNAFGVTEPIVQVENGSALQGSQHRLIVDLPGVTDVQEAIKLINITPTLEFKTPRPEGPEKEAILRAYEDAQKLLASGSASTTINPNNPILKNPLLQEDPNFVSSGLTGRYLKSAQVSFNQNSINPSISVEFNSEGAALFSKITKENIGKPIGIYLDGAPISAPTVREAITNGKAEISGQFTLDEAKELTRNLNLGALPVPISLLSTETIGATLGEAALRDGFKAAWIGFLIIALFMILYYRLPGLVAVVSLSLYIVLILTIFKVVGVTITAAGIAGLILSLGIAVDANVLVFSRLKEELRRGDHIHNALHEAFGRAWTSIRDSNISTIISSIILFWFGTAFIKGFALTLIIGVLASMFTAITVTRVLLVAIAPSRKVGISRFLFGSGVKN